MDELTKLAIAAVELGVNSMTLEVDNSTYINIKNYIYKQYNPSNFLPIDLLFKINENTDKMELIWCGVFTTIINKHKNK